jgi:hypothetical protein
VFTGVLSHQALPWTRWVSLTLSLQNRCPSNIKSCIRVSVQYKVNALLKFSVGSRTLEIWFCQFFWMLLFFLIFYRINYIIIHQLLKFFFFILKKLSWQSHTWHCRKWLRIKSSLFQSDIKIVLCQLSIHIGFLS